MRIENDVILRAQISFTQLLVGEVGVRHAVVIQRGARPSFILGPLPGMNVADAGNVQRVGFHDGQRRDSHRGESQVLNGWLNGGAIGVRNDERAGAEFVAVDFKILLRRQHLYVRHS